MLRKPVLEILYDVSGSRMNLMCCYIVWFYVNMLLF